MKFTEDQILIQIQSADVSTASLHRIGTDEYWALLFSFEGKLYRIKAIFLNGRFLFPDMGADDTIEIPPFIIPLP